MATLLSILASIGSIAGFYGLDAIVSSVERSRARAQGMSPTQIISTIRRLIADIKNKSVDAYNKLSDEVNNMPQIMSAGGLQQYLSTAKREKQDALLAAQKRLNDVEQKVSDVDTMAANLAAQTDSYRKSKTGKAELEDIVRQAKSITGGDQIEKSARE